MSAELPIGMTRVECVDGPRALREMAMAWEKQKCPSFVRWPDLDALLDYIEVFGLPPRAGKAGL